MNDKEETATKGNVMLHNYENTMQKQKNVLKLQNTALRSLP